MADERGLRFIGVVLAIATLVATFAAAFTVSL